MRLSHTHSFSLRFLLSRKFPRLILYFFALSLAFPIDATARKKEKDGKGMAAYAAIEPGAQPGKEKREKAATRVLALDHHSEAKVNTRYR